MRSYKLWALLALIALFALVLIYRNGLVFSLTGDEEHFWPSALLFSHEPIPSIHLLRNYTEITGPVPFMVAGWIIRLFGPEIQYVRLFDFGLSFVLLLLFLGLSRSWQRFWTAAIGLLLFPYVYYCGTLFYTDILTVLFIVLGWVGYQKKKHLVSGLCFVLAISCRQYTVVFPLAVLAYELVPLLLRVGTWPRLRMSLLVHSYLLYYVLAAGAFLSWTVFWGGPGPAPELIRQKYTDTVQQLMYKPGFVLYAAACLGAYYVIPELLLTGRPRFYALESDQRWQLAGWVGLLMGVILFFPAQQMYDGFFIVHNMGFLDRHLEMVHITGWVKQALFGGLALLTILRFASSKSGLAGWVVLLNLLLMGKTHIAWDKYLMPALATLWLLTLFEERNPIRQLYRHWIKNQMLVERTA